MRMLQYVIQVQQLGLRVGAKKNPSQWHLGDSF